MNDKERRGGDARKLVAVAVALGAIGIGGSTALHRPAPATVASTHIGDVSPTVGDRWYLDPPFAQSTAAPLGDRWYDDPGE